MAIDSTKKSSRFLQGRRYTHDTLTDAQEAFTSVLDINSNEVYLDSNLIPSASLPFSGSSQSGSIYSVGGQNVLKYYYRQKLTKSDLNNEVWFFTLPTGSSSGIGAQLIDNGQQGSFISPKYSVSALTNANTEDATPGYGVKVLIDTIQQSVNSYAFDYKTGVLQFSSSAVAPTGSQVVYISAYQYVGRTLAAYQTGSFTGSFTGSLLGTSSYAVSASFVPGMTNGTASNAVSSSYALTASYVLQAVSASYASTASYATNLTVSGTLTVQNIVAQTITSSTEFITGSTKFGSQLSNTHQFTGSVSVTGSLSVGGNLIATSFSGSGANLTGIDTIEKVFYVAEDGSDTNDGKSLSFPFRTIKAATIAASASRAANPGLPVYRQSIQIKSGYYSEEAPITVPSNVSILGDDLRSVVVAPTTATSGSNLFLMNNGTYCWGLRLEGCKIDNLEDPRNGFFFAFAPSASIVTSPYVQNCSAISTPADKFYTPLDSGSANPLVGNGPGGMIIDDSVLDGYSPLKSMIVDAYTQVAFNGIGICVRGRGYGQLVSFFTNFSRVGVYCIEGGHASLLNSNTTFGDFGLRSKGKRMLVKPDITPVSASIDVSGSLLVSANKTNIQTYMINKLVQSGSFASTYVSGSGSQYASTIKDSGLLIDAIADDLLSPGAARTSQFTSGLFKGQDVSSGSIYTLPIASGSTFTEGAISVIPQNVSNASGSLTGDFIKAWQYMKEYIVTDPSGNFSTMSAGAKGKVSQLFDVLISTITQVVVNGAGASLLEEFGSLITSTSHDFSYAGAGVNFLALPLNQGGVGETNIALRVYQEDGGRVYYTAGDETGDQYQGNDFVIRQQTGTIEGRTFNKSISALITPLNLALEG
jgi:hypothetical protein